MHKLHDDVFSERWRHRHTGTGRQSRYVGVALVLRSCSISTNYEGYGYMATMPA